MKSDDILRASVQAMKRLLGLEGVTAASKKARERDKVKNAALLDTCRVQINELVRSLRETGDPGNVIRETSIDLKVARVIRYLKNREMFMQTFPAGSRVSILTLLRSGERS
jgi:mevalonate pyrophosphate decarboxylase